MPEASAATVEEFSREIETMFQLLLIKDVAANPDNARNMAKITPERKAKLDELIASIRKDGVLQPVVVRPAKEGEEGKYVVMAGDRRRLAVLTIAEQDGSVDIVKIPAMIRSGDSAENAHDVMATENLVREDFTEFEEARAYKRYFDQFGYTGRTAYRDVAKKFKVSSGHVRQRIALLTMPEPVLEAWRNEDLTAGHVEQLTRLSDEKEILKHLTFCLQGGRLPTIKDLRERIEQDVPELEFAKFDKEDCASCACNSSQQQALFLVDSDSLEGSKCLKPTCFIQKQKDFFSENWEKGKAKQILGTNGFIFQHEMIVTEREEIKADKPQATCLKCDKFLTTVNIKGGIVEKRICAGPKACFEELYVLKPKLTEAEKPPATRGGSEKQPPLESSGGKKKAKATSGEGKAELSPQKAKEAAEKAARTSKHHGEREREKVFKDVIPARVNALDPESVMAKRMALLGLLLANHQAAKHFAKKRGSGMEHFCSDRKGDLAKLVFDAPDKVIMASLVEAALLPIMNDDGYNSTSSAEVRLATATALEVDLSTEWVITKDYLSAKMKNAIFRLGEELDFWIDEKVLAYKKEHFPKTTAIMALKKDQMIDLILKSGIDLKGKIPQEVLLAA